MREVTIQTTESILWSSLSLFVTPNWCIVFRSITRSSFWAVMVAAVSCRGRRVACVSKTKDLFFTFTLLSLLCPASSWIDKDKQREIKENIQKLHQDAVMRRVDNMVDKIFFPRIFEEISQLMETLTEMIKHVVSEFGPLPELMKELKSYLKECRNYMIKYLEKEAAQNQEYEDKVKQLERVMAKLAEVEANM
ncbi:hypothetical protein ATANTOWER_012513 [Ataeniobius toweri]|uniref:Uncharacterized protein n=1 Tax=Ataeniobius toweri TaxID=208326 RepID=A0ABU7B7L8_9TELE|nr:hypothetical protein [Ataeniobius toweri]